jgi:FkbM family methyltransferase
VNATLTRLARPGSAVIDVGANIGATALPLAKIVGPQGRVICFEPIAANIERLRQNIILNDVPWVQVEPVALSDRQGELVMDFAMNHAGMARVIDPWSDMNASRVSCLRFDDWVSTQDGLSISVCKIDVEGHEAKVFSGMEKTLTKRSIPAFVFERHVADANPDPVFQLLRDAGYRLLQIRKGLLRSFYVDSDGSRPGRATHDFVAILPHVRLDRAGLHLGNSTPPGADA